MPIDDATASHAPSQADLNRLAAQGPISDEPLINAVHRRLVELAFVLYTIVLVYMSFVPFDFTKAVKFDGRGVVWGLALHPFNVPDIFANIAIYVPLGVLFFAVLRRRGLGRIVATMVTLLFASLLGFLIEQGQHWVISRVSTWVDVTSNALGAALGALLIAFSEGTIRRVLLKSKWAAQRNWWLTLAKGAVCLVLLINLRPYDVVVDMFHTAADLRHADVSPLAHWNSLQTEVAHDVEIGRRSDMNDLARVRWEYGLDRAVDIAAYAGIAALLVLGLAPTFKTRWALCIWAGFVTVSLAMIATLIRVFLISHGLDTAHFACGVIGWPIGCAVGLVVMRALARRAREEGRFSLALPRFWQPAIIACVVAVVLLYELVPFDFGTGRGAESATNAARLCLLPFEAHFHSRPNDAFMDLSGEILRYGIFGSCLALMLWARSRNAWRRQLLLVVAVSAITGALLEGLHLVMASRQTDLTTVVLALFGGFVGAVTVRWTHDFRGSLAVVEKDDLLTSQLIEGETYKPLPEIEPRQTEDLSQTGEPQEIAEPQRADEPLADDDFLTD